MTQKMPMPEFQWRQELCGTCEYWGGERELDFRNAQLMYVQAQICPQPRCAGARPPLWCGADFLGVVLTEADFAGAGLAGARPGCACLVGAGLTGPCLGGAGLG